MGRALIGLVVLLGSATVAVAGDYADREIIGFSPDGATFAFEEYGVQDGSGFPYSNIYVIDTASDSWVPGTPIRVRTDVDAAPLAETRAEARDLARKHLEERGIAVAGTLVLTNPATETSADPHHVSFLPRLIVPVSGIGVRLDLAETELPAAGCPDFGAPYKGFALTLTGAEGGTTTLHSDTQIPKSRRCPTGYAISDVVVHHPEPGDPVTAVLVSIYSVGFEGPDRRFLAVATRLKE